MDSAQTFQNWAQYNNIDSAVTFGVFNAIKDECIETDYKSTYEWTIKLYPVLVYMMTRGIKADQEAIKETDKYVAEQIEIKEAELNKLAGCSLNAGSYPQCVAYFYGTLGFPPYTKVGGGITTDDKAMARLARKGVKEAKLVQEIRGFRKLKGTYLETTIDPDGRLRCSYNPRGTKNGRLSSSETIFGTGTNMQNLHPEYKKFLIPDDDHIFIELDKRQSEWVISAYASGDPRMMAAIKSGIDVHANTAELITGVPYDLVKIEDKIIGHQSDPDIIFQLRQEQCPEIFDAARFLPRSMSCRQGGKKSNHGLNYRMKFRRFALENELPENESKIIVEAYSGWGGYSQLPLWWERTENQLRKDRCLVNCFGHKRRFMDEWGPDLINAAVAFIPQSTNANLINQALIAIYNDTADDIMRTIDLLTQTHDSILFQYPINQWRNLALAIETMCVYLNPLMCYEGREFRIATDMKIGLNWGDGGERNPKGMVEIPISDNISELADQMEAHHASIR